MFMYIENTDPMKSKQLEKGIQQLMDEGVAQLFIHQFNGRKVIGTVGQLQFEVIQYRLLHEYGAQCRWEPMSMYKACWIESDDAAALEAFKRRKHQFMAVDREGRDVFLADSQFVLTMAQNDFPQNPLPLLERILKHYETGPILTAEQKYNPSEKSRLDLISQAGFLDRYIKRQKSRSQL